MRLPSPLNTRNVFRRVALLLSVLLVVALSGGAAFAQTGFTGIFGGGPFYINATNNITEIGLRVRF